MTRISRRHQVVYLLAGMVAILLAKSALTQSECTPPIVEPIAPMGWYVHCQDRPECRILMDPLAGYSFCSPLEGADPFSPWDDWCACLRFLNPPVGGGGGGGDDDDDDGSCWNDPPALDCLQPGWGEPWGPEPPELDSSTLQANNCNTDLWSLMSATLVSGPLGQIEEGQVYQISRANLSQLVKYGHAKSETVLFPQISGTFEIGPQSIDHPELHYLLVRSFGATHCCPN